MQQRNDLGNMITNKQENENNKNKNDYKDSFFNGDESKNENYQDLMKAKAKNNHRNYESNYEYMETTGANKINDAYIMEYPKLELKDLEGNLLDGNCIFINAGGIVNGGLRNASDGYSFFGYHKSKNNQIVNDYILNTSNNFGLNIVTAFKIFFDKIYKQYYLAPSTTDDDSIVFVKLEKAFKITKRLIISIGEIHISVDVDDDLALKIELIYGNEEMKTNIFSKELYNLVKIGRNKDNDIVLENYAYSRIHSSFIFDDEENAWFVQDGYENKLSTNGTWIYLDWPWCLEDNIKFRIGSSFLILSKI